MQLRHKMTDGRVCQIKFMRLCVFFTIRLYLDNLRNFTNVHSLGSIRSSFTLVFVGRDDLTTFIVD